MRLPDHIPRGHVEALEPRVLLSFSLNVNFAPAGVTAPAGYVGDSGQVFGDRGNGYSYGWDADNTANTRQRSAQPSPDVRYDTLAMMQKDGALTWEAAVPNGEYRIHLVAGDPTYSSGTQHLMAEGVNLINEPTNPLKMWAEGWARVTVSDGRLTVYVGPSAGFAKLCFLEITDDLASPIAPPPEFPTIARDITMGTNLDGIAYWSTISPFIDLTAQFSPWTSNLDVPPVTGSSWPAAVNSLNYPTGDAAAMTFATGYPTGDYSVSYKGTGTVSFSRWSTYGGFKIEDLAFTPVTQADGTRTGTVFLDIPSQLEAWYFAITITGQDTNDPIRELHVNSPDAQPARSTIFRPVFLDKVAAFDGPLRVMDWMQIPGSVVSKWSDRPQLGRFSYYPGGVPYELWIALANTLHKDLWINLPHLATNDSIRQPVVPGYTTLMATLLRDTLDPTLKIYVEYSNEVWNSGSLQGDYVYKVAVTDNELTKPAEDKFGRAAEEFGKLTVNKVSIPFKNVFGAQRFAEQVRPVLGGFVASSYWADSALRFIRHKWGDPSQYISGVAIAPYVGHESDMASINTPDLTLDILFAWMNDWLDTKVAPWIAYNKYTADNFEIPLLAYEGGQHLEYYIVPDNAGVKTAAQDDPRMADFYRRLLKVWTQYGGGAFANFALAAKNSQYGFFGNLTSINQADSTKFAVVRELANTTLWLAPDQAGEMAALFPAPPVYPSTTPKPKPGKPVVKPEKPNPPWVVKPVKPAKPVKRAASKGVVKSIAAAPAVRVAHVLFSRKKVDAVWG